MLAADAGHPELVNAVLVLEISEPWELGLVRVQVVADPEAVRAAAFPGDTLVVQPKNPLTLDGRQIERAILSFRHHDEMISDVLSGARVGVNGIAMDTSGGELRFLATIRRARESDGPSAVSCGGNR